jgi:hypothetical protein
MEQMFFSFFDRLKIHRLCVVLTFSTSSWIENKEEKRWMFLNQTFFSHFHFSFNSTELMKHIYYVLVLFVNWRFEEICYCLSKLKKLLIWDVILFRVFVPHLNLCFAAVEISIEWDEIVFQSVTTPTLQVTIWTRLLILIVDFAFSNQNFQVVVNPMIRRTSPIHDRVFEMLHNLQAEYVRFVPWLPYPRLSVVHLLLFVVFSLFLVFHILYLFISFLKAELQPPTRNPQCATILNLQTLYLSCYADVFIFHTLWLLSIWRIFCFSISKFCFLG